MPLPGLEHREQQRLIGNVRSRITNSLTALIGRRTDLAERLKATRMAVEEVEKALALIGRAESEVERRLKDLPLQEIPRAGRLIVEHEFRQRRELLRVQRDLPSIRAYWQAKAKALGLDVKPAKAASTAT